jgi:hypothetical protein
MTLARTLKRAARTLAVLGVLLPVAAPLGAQPAQPPGPPGPGGPGRPGPQRPGGMPQPAPLPVPHEPEIPRKPPTKEDQDKQLERVKRQAADRKAKRDERGRDRRKALRKTMRRWLRGGPITESVRAGLQEHARRIARLLRLEEIAAARNDYELAMRIEKLVARENARHDKWLRDLSRPAKPTATAAGSSATASPKEETQP